MTRKFNARVEAAVKTVRWKLAFTVCGIGVGIATGGPVGAAAMAALSLVQFAKLDRKPVIDTGNTEPAAMFHDIDTRLGLLMQ